MGIFREIPPTAGIPICLGDIFSAFTGRRGAAPLEDDLKKYLGVSYARLTNSGTAALYLILETLKGISSRKTVIIPSYICPLVPLAIARAGLKVEVCDITGRDFNFNAGELERLSAANRDVLAIVAAHIGGIPLDLAPVKEIAARNDIFLIEDCAQSLGALHDGRAVGTFGDLSFFSLARGKGLTIYEGGLLAANKKDLAGAIDTTIDRLVKKNPLSESLKILELLGYWAFYRPELFWFAFRLPQNFWKMMGDEVKANQDHYTVDFPVHGVSGFRQAVGHAGFHRLDGAIKDQRERARYLMEGLEGISGMTIVKGSEGDTATYPFITAVFDSTKRRDRALEVLKAGGLGASITYLRAITDYGYLKGVVPYRDGPGGSAIASRAVSLSTSCYLDTKDLAVVINMLKEDLEC